MTTTGDIVNELYEFYGASRFYPSKAQWQQLIDAPNPGRFVMTNLFKIKTQAPDPYQPEDVLSGLELLQRYQSYSAAAVAAVGGKSTMQALVQQTVIGPQQLWDVLGMVEYPSVEAFVNVFRDPDYRQGHLYREAASEAHHMFMTLPIDI